MSSFYPVYATDSVIAATLDTSNVLISFNVYTNAERTRFGIIPVIDTVNGFKSLEGFWVDADPRLNRQEQEWVEVLQDAACGQFRAMLQVLRGLNGRRDVDYRYLDVEDCLFEACEIMASFLAKGN